MLEDEYMGESKEMKRKISIFVLASFLLSLILPDIVMARKPIRSEQYSIAVLPIEKRGSLRLTDSRKITYYLYNEFKNMLEYDALDMVMVEDILRKNELDIFACSTLNCEIEAGNALEVDFLVNGVVEKRGTNYILDIRLINVSDGNILNSVNTVFKGHFEELQNYMGVVATRLVGSHEDRMKGLVLTSDQQQVKRISTNRTNIWLITGLVLASGAGLGMYFLNKNNDKPQIIQPDQATPLPGPPSFP